MEQVETDRFSIGKYTKINQGCLSDCQKYKLVVKINMITDMLWRVTQFLTVFFRTTKTTVSTRAWHAF